MAGMGTTTLAKGFDVAKNQLLESIVRSASPKGKTYLSPVLNDIKSEIQSSREQNITRVY